MNILLWIVQVVLALLYLAGGAFKTFNPGDVAKQITALASALESRSPAPSRSRPRPSAPGAASGFG